MTDLARQAAEEIASVERPFWKHGDVVLDIESTINRHGTLVSHEDAALLREVKRMMVSITESDRRASFIDYIGYAMDETHWKVAYDGQVSETIVGFGDTLTEALKLALDAAGVPDAKGT